MGSDCQSKPDACRERLLPVLHDTDVGTHAKRFVMFAVGLALLVQLVVAELIILSAETAYLATDEKPTVRYHLPYNDLNRIHNLDYSDKIAVQYGAMGTPSTITVPVSTEAATATGAQITLETVTADAGLRKTGDIVYHIPQESTIVIQNFLAMMGVEAVIDACAGQDLLYTQVSRARRHSKRAELQECIRQIAAMVPDFMDSVPEQALQLAAQNFPMPVGPGQAIGYPVPVMRNPGGEYVIIGVYHVAFMHRRGAAAPVPAPTTSQFDIPTLVKSALGLTILMHAVMHAGQVAMELWIPQSAVKTDINIDELTCPKEILCFDDACGAQGDSAIQAQDTWCKTVSCFVQLIQAASLFYATLT
jgi:hypothetical protein